MLPSKIADTHAHPLFTATQKSSRFNRCKMPGSWPVPAIFGAIVFSLGLSGAALAQAPAVTTTGLPAEPLIGEIFCADVVFTNFAPPTGYGPYLIGITDTGISNISIDFVDIPPPLETIGTFDQTGTLIDPISDQSITGNEGGSARIARYPVGSVEQNQTPLVMNYCGVVDVNTEIGVPLDIEIIPGFEYGDTPTGENGALLGPSEIGTVTPQLARVRKTNSAPEGERPPGPSHAFNYTWEMAVSESVTITDVLASDTLPNNIQYTGGVVSITAPLSQGCEILTLPNTPPDAGGTLVVECEAVTGSGGNGDLVVSLPVYITDILDEAIADQQDINNTVNIDYRYQEQDYSSSDSSNVLAVHAAAQKSVSGNPLPGETLEYVVTFQLTDYPEGSGDSATGFIFSDIIPDGMVFVGTLALTIDGANLGIVESVTPNTPAPGQTTIVWDIATELGTGLSNGSTGTLRYQTRILDQYDDGTPVQAADPLNNQLELGYMLSRGASDSNDSTADIIITPNTADKEITDPPPPVMELMPGQQITFLLSLEIPAGSTSNVRFKDLLPRPVFDVADFDSATDWNVLPPFDALSPTVSTNPGNNSVTLDFGDITNALSSTLSVELLAMVTSEPFADDLFLTNLFSSSYDNTDGDTITGLRAVALAVGAPELVITKGVLMVDNPAAVISPLPGILPVDGDVTGADYSDTIEYQITVENIGGQSAFSVTIKDPVRSGLDCAASMAGDVVDGNGNELAFTGNLTSPAGLVLTNPVSGNDGSPEAGGAPYSTDTAIITTRCQLELSVTPGQTITNDANVRWVSTPGSNDLFPEQTDDASVFISLPSMTKSVIATNPGYTGDLKQIHIGEILTYQLDITVPEGTSPAVKLEDIVDEGLAHVEVVSVTALSPDLLTSIGSFDDVAANAGFSSAGGGEAAIDRKLVFGPGNNDAGFGIITNNNQVNGSDEVIRVIYLVRALNATSNVTGTGLGNRARWSWTPTGGIERNIQVRADRINIVEPQLNLSKTFIPDTGDNESPPRVIIALDHLGPSVADGYDLTFTDALPRDMGIDGGVTLDNCPAGTTPLVVRENGSDTLTITWPEFETNNGACIITFDTEFIFPVIAGITLENCANLSWESMADSNQPADGSPNNSPGIASERTGFVADPGGGANDYLTQACDQYKVFGLGISKTVSGSSQSHTDNIPGTPAGAESLTIGELVYFDLFVTVPEAPALDIEVADALPKTTMTLELVSADTLFVGDDLTPTIPNPVPLIIDTSGNGINDSVSLDYGFTAHNTNMVTNNDDRIGIRVVAKVLDLDENANNDFDRNSGIIRFLPNASATDGYGIELVEPLLNVEKIGNRTRVEGGDDIGYRLTLSHSPASRIDAQDITLTDLLPPDLLLDASSIATGSVCTVLPDSGPSAAGNGVTASWDSFPLGGVCEIEFLASVSILAETGNEIDNIVSVSWTSLDTEGDEDDRLYHREDAWKVIVSAPGLLKTMTSSNVPETLFTLAAPSQKLTVGEEATFTITALFADGTTPSATLQDVLPDISVALEFTGSRIVFIGEDLDIDTNPVVGEPAVACSPSSEQCLQWVLGDVVNQRDAGPSPELRNAMIFSVDVIVLDDPLNSGAPGEDDNLLNIANLIGSGFIVSASDQFDVVEPQLTIQKLTESGRPEDVTAAGAEHTFTIVLEHLPDSTSAALGLEIVDRLSPQMAWLDDSSVTSDCPNFMFDAPPAEQTGSVIFSISELPVATQRCTISFTVKMSDALPTPGTYVNTAAVTWESAPGSLESRSYADEVRAFLVTLNDAGVRKSVAATSVPDTKLRQFDPLLRDVTIGEIVEYVIVSRFSEGRTNRAVLTDIFQMDGGGELELLGGEIIFLGANISTSLPGTPVVTGNTIEIDYGSVTNIPDGLDSEDDSIVYRLELLIADSATNTAGNELINEVTLAYQGLLNTTLFIEDDATVEVVEPELELSKSFTGVEADRVTLRLELTNTGSAPAYDVAITDEFDETLWVPGSLEIISLPPGYSLTDASSGGVTTVTLALENVSTPPRGPEVLTPTETITAIFSVRLTNNGQPGPTTIVNTAVAEADSLPGDNPRQRTYTSDASDTILLPALNLEKTWAGPNTPALPGDTLTYTLTLTNTGDASASNIRVADTPDVIGALQAGSVTTIRGTNPDAGSIVIGNSSGDIEVEVTFAEVSAGSSVDISYDVLIPLPYPDGMTAPEQLVNQATADSFELTTIVSDNPDTATEEDETVVPILADPVMIVTKNDQVIFTLPGETIIYQIDYGNVGSQDATGVIVSDIVPEDTAFSAAQSSTGWSCSNGAPAGTLCQQDIGALAGASGGVLFFAVTVQDPVASGVISIFNTASITEDGVEFGQPTSPPSADDDMEETPLFARPILEVFKNDGGVSTAPGETLRYAIVYRNIGPQIATGVVLTETVPNDVVYDASASRPAWTCPNGGTAGTVCTLDVGELGVEVGRGAIFGLQVITPARPGLALISNTVILNDDGANTPSPLIEEASDDTPLIANPDLIIHKTSDGGPIFINKVLTYAINYRNVGNQNATGVVIRERVPQSTAFSEENSAPTLWSCDDGAGSGSSCSHNVGNLAAGESGEITFAVTVLETPGDAQIVNVVETNDDGISGPDPTPLNNIARVIDSFLPSGIPAIPAILLLMLSLGVAGLSWRAIARRGRR
ncbi:MAG: putative repeat protein (TIGR01451 family) [Alcanivorax sp.]|jgi:uncharacterized repeat protein (TIGR01451 family)